MSTGKDPKTMPITVEYENGYERTFGTKEPKRGKWVIDPKTGELVPAEKYVPGPVRSTAPRVDLYMDGMKTLGGDDISSKKKRREYMKRTGLTDYSDWTETREKAAKVRESYFTQGGPESEKKARRELIGRLAYEKKLKF